MSTDDQPENETLAAERSMGADLVTNEGLFAPITNFFSRLNADPILPEAGAGGTSLIALIAVMSFLASLALAGFLVITAASGEWASELQSAVTIQVKGDNAEVIAADTQAALGVLNSTPGVLSAVAMSTDEAAGLLRPWLGNNDLSQYLNIPAIIKVEIEPGLRDDLGVLRTRLAAAAPGAVIDDHRAWHSRLSAAVRSGQAIAFAIFLLVLGAACAISAFAARAGLAANHEIVSLLHLVGATDGFIANEVQARFFSLGLKGALFGAAAAFFAITLIAMTTSSSNDGFFVSIPEFGWSSGLWLIAVPLVTCLVTAITARFTVLNTLSERY